MAGIFINYRREDSGGYAGRIYEALAKEFGKDSVFIDINAIKPGEDFPAVLRERVEQCSVFLAVIGRTWLRATSEDGRRRLDDAGDFVRQEIAMALKREINVIPVLVGGAHMPSANELPPEIRSFALRNAYEIPDRFFRESIRGLIDAVRTDMPPQVPSARWLRRSVLGLAVAVPAIGLGVKLSLPALSSLMSLPAPDFTRAISIHASNFARGQNIEWSGSIGPDVLHVLRYWRTDEPVWAEFDIPVSADQSGKYRLFATYTSAERRPVTISWNRHEKSTNALSTNTGSWYPSGNVKDEDQRIEVDAAQGTNVLRIWRASHIPHITSFKLAPRG